MPQEQPDWWDWPLELTPHVLRRMVDRRFTETDLRTMWHDATLVRPDHIQGRWLVTSRRLRDHWAIIVEPDDTRQVVVVITAYRID